VFARVFALGLWISSIRYSTLCLVCDIVFAFRVRHKLGLDIDAYSVLVFFRPLFSPALVLGLCYLLNCKDISI